MQGTAPDAAGLSALPKTHPEAPEQTIRPLAAPRAPGNDPGGPPSSEVKGKAAAPLNQPSQSSPDKGCRGAAGPGGPGQGWLVGSSTPGSQAEGCGGGAGLQRGRGNPILDPIASTKLTPLGLCSLVVLLPPVWPWKRGNPSTVRGVFHSWIIYGRSICQALYLISAFTSSFTMSLRGGFVAFFFFFALKNPPKALKGPLCPFPVLGLEQLLQGNCTETLGAQTASSRGTSALAGV